MTGSDSSSSERTSLLTELENNLLTLLEGLSIHQADPPPLPPQKTSRQMEYQIPHLTDSNSQAHPFGLQSSTLFHQGEGSLETQGNLTSHNRIQVSHPLDSLSLGEGELLDKIHSLRLLNPDSQESLSISGLLDLEKMFRVYPYPWIFTLMMRDLAQAYDPLSTLRDQKGTPSMVTSTMPCVYSTQFQGTWDFTMQLLMPVLVGHLSPSGWHQLFNTMSWLLHTQTVSKSDSHPMKHLSMASCIDTDMLKQHLPDGWTNALINMARTLSISIDKTEDFTHTLRENLENSLIDMAAEDPWIMKDLVEHVIVVDNIKSGRLLRWLAADPFIITDDPQFRIPYLELYNKVYSFGGEVYRTSKGPRITIPENQWILYEDMDYSAQEDFAHIAWLQIIQFNRRMFINALDGSYSSFRNYIIDIMWETGAYKTLNKLVIKEIQDSDIWPIDGQVDPHWKDADIKPDVFLPASGSFLGWDNTRKGWYRKSEEIKWLELKRNPDGTYGGYWDKTEEVNWKFNSAKEQGSECSSRYPNTPKTPSLASDSSMSEEEDGKSNEGPLLYEGTNNISKSSLISIGSSSSSEDSSICECHPTMVESQFLSDNMNFSLC
jgi:hypothetical protein